MKPAMFSRVSPSCSPFVAKTTSITTMRCGRGASLPMARSAMAKLRKAVPMIVALLFSSMTGASAQEPYGIGHTATPAEIAGWNIDVGRDGRGLPPGTGSVTHGRDVFEQQCAACHGDKGQGGAGDRLAGGRGTLATSNPVKT